MGISEGLFILGVYTAGFLFSSLFLKNEPPYFISVISLFSGISLFFFSCIPLVFIFGSISPIVLTAVQLVLLSLLLGSHVCLSRNWVLTISYMLVSSSLLMILCGVLSKFDFNLFCGDTFHLSNCAKRFSESPQLVLENIKSLTGWGALFVLLQHVSHNLGIPYFILMQPLLCISFVLFFQAFVYKALIKLDTDRIYALVSSIFAAVLLATSPIFLNVVLLLHTNAFLTYYLFLSIAFYWMGNLTTDKNWYYMAYVFMLTASFSRAEAPVYCTIILLCLLFDNNLKNYKIDKNIVPHKEMRAFPQKVTQSFFENNLFNFALFYFLLMGAWFSFLYFVGTDNGILSNSRTLFLACVFLMMPIVITVLNLPFFGFLRGNFFNLVYIGCGCALFIAVFIPSEHLSSSLQGVLKNLNNTLWRGMELFILISTIFFMVNRKEKFFMEKTILSTIFLVVLCIISFSFFRAPFYRAVYDSSNRLFVMLIPIFIFYLTIKLHAPHAAHISNFSIGAFLQKMKIYLKLRGKSLIVR